MNKQILCYLPFKATETSNQILCISKASDIKCVIANNPSVFYKKYKNSSIIVYKSSSKKMVKHMCALLPYANKYFCTPKELPNAILQLKQKHIYIEKIKNDLMFFFDYINMPAINTSYILIKHTIFNMKELGIKKCNYKIISTSCKNLGLTWEKEKTYLRKNIKKWYQANKDNFYNLYPALILPKYKLLDFINMIYESYLLKEHNKKCTSVFILKEYINKLTQNDIQLLTDLES